MLVLGLSGGFSTMSREFLPSLPPWLFHDASAALIADGRVIAAIEEERLNRIKHTTKFPAQSIEYCLREAGVDIGSVDAIAYYFGESYPNRELALQRSVRPGYSDLDAKSLLKQRLNEQYGDRVDSIETVFVSHHAAHAYSAYFNSGHDESIVGVMDGRGDNESLSVLVTSGSRLQTVSTSPVRDSLGVFYDTAIELLGYSYFDEYKVMGLAPHGDPNTFRSIFRTLYDLGGNGTYRIDLPRVIAAFVERDFKPRQRGQVFTKQHCDFAAGLQETLETIVLHVFHHWSRTTGLRHLCLSGGVAHNSAMNGRLLYSGMFDRIFVDPAAHDAGAAVGAAMYVCRQHAGSRFSPQPLQNVYWGPSVGSEQAILTELEPWRDFLRITACDDIERAAAELLAGGAVLGWVQGRSEFGPRALGNRSILADPRPSGNRERINEMVKRREAYRPFAPAVLAEEMSDYFETPVTTARLDFMTFVVRVRDERRELLGAVTHVDGTARVQVVRRDENERFWRLIRYFADLTGVPVVLNTSFNNNAEPIVQSVSDAVTCFLTSGIDYVVIGNVLIEKEEHDWTRWSDLVPGLASTVELRQVIRSISHGQSEIVYEAQFAHAGGMGTEITQEIFDILSLSDGSRTVRELAVAAGGTGGVTRDQMTEVLTLWMNRYVILAPPAMSLVSRRSRVYFPGEASRKRGEWT